MQYNTIPGIQYQGYQGYQGNPGYGYQDRYQSAQYQQPFYGKIVDNFDSVTANDVPMNGQPATFIKNDGSEIQVRVWTANGTIATTRYMPYSEPKKEDAENVSSDSLKSLYDDFQDFKEQIISRFDRLDKSVSGKSNSGRGTKREVESDE